MASVTGVVLVGSPHQNDTSISPDFLLELWEGSRATWVLRRLEDGKILTRKSPDSPDLIGEALLEVLNSVMPASTDHVDRIVDMAVIAVPLPGSSLLNHVHLLRDLRVCDVHIMEPVFSRTYSAWSGQWNVTDISAGSAEGNR